MTLIGLDATSIHIIPQSNASVQGPCKHKFAIWTEPNGADGRVVFMDEGAQTLPSGCIPNANQTIAATGNYEGAVPDLHSYHKE